MSLNFSANGRGRPAWHEIHVGSSSGVKLSQNCDFLFKLVPFSVQGKMDTIQLHALKEYSSNFC